jgi:hypothetical protein
MDDIFHLTQNGMYDVIFISHKIKFMIYFHLTQNEIYVIIFILHKMKYML